MMYRPAGIGGVVKKPSTSVRPERITSPVLRLIMLTTMGGEPPVMQTTLPVKIMGAKKSAHGVKSETILIQR